MLQTSIRASAAAMLLLASLAAGAHAFLDRADPRVGSTVASAPAELTLWFTQKLEPAFSTVAVTDASGERVDVGKPRIEGDVMHVPLRALSAGHYHVKWRVLSVDTHTTEGAFSFHVSP